MPEIFFNGPVGRIEGIYTQSENPKAPLALLLHPHPLYGGTMNNKALYNIHKSLINIGFTVLRINFRGVGRSQGKFDNGVGELTDAARALDWLQLHNQFNRVNVIIGFSFGAWIGMQLIMRRPEISNFVAISPPVNKFDFSFLSPCPVSGLIVHGSYDSIVPEEAMLELLNKLSKQKNIKITHKTIAGADHFFRNKIPEVTDAVTEYLQANCINKYKNIMQSRTEDSSDNIEELTKQKVYLD